MNETKPSETKPKRKVSRNVAIALGIVCIILVIGLVGAFAYYVPMVNDKDNKISSMNSQISQSNTNNTNLQNKINQLQTYLDGNETLLDETQSCLDSNITAYNAYLADHHYTDEQYSNLQSTITSLQNQISSLNTQITNLQNQIANLRAPNVIEVNLKSDDNHPLFGAEYLHVYGELCNVGTNTAYNCKLHVVGYQSGGVVAFDTYIVAGTISGYSWKSVDGSITYTGGALTSWTITPQWTSS